jgi:hypothetical protein
MGMQWTELAMTSAEFDELARPYYTKVPKTTGAPPPMIQWRHFARDMQKLADELLTDKDIAAAERLDGTNAADVNNTRNDGYFKGKAGEDMSPDGKRLKKRQSAAALASGILECVPPPPPPPPPPPLTPPNCFCNCCCSDSPYRAILPPLPLPRRRCLAAAHAAAAASPLLRRLASGSCVDRA